MSSISEHSKVTGDGNAKLKVGVLVVAVLVVVAVWANNSNRSLTAGNSSDLFVQSKGRNLEKEMKARELEEPRLDCLRRISEKSRMFWSEKIQDVATHFRISAEAVFVKSDGRSEVDLKRNMEPFSHGRWRRVNWKNFGEGKVDVLMKDNTVVCVDLDTCEISRVYEASSDGLVNPRLSNDKLLTFESVARQYTPTLARPRPQGSMRAHGLRVSADGLTPGVYIIQNRGSGKVASIYAWGAPLWQYQRLANTYPDCTHQRWKVERYHNNFFKIHSNCKTQYRWSAPSENLHTQVSVTLATHDVSHEVFSILGVHTQDCDEKFLGWSIDRYGNGKNVVGLAHATNANGAYVRLEPFDYIRSPHNLWDFWRV